jgi:hypothetical protein
MKHGAASGYATEVSNAAMALRVGVSIMINMCWIHCIQVLYFLNVLLVKGRKHTRRWQGQASNRGRHRRRRHDPVPRRLRRGCLRAVALA